MGYTVVLFAETLHHKQEGRGFNSQWSYLEFSLTSTLQLPFGPVVGSASKRNEYQGCLVG